MVLSSRSKLQLNKNTRDADVKDEHAVFSGERSALDCGFCAGATRNLITREIALHLQRVGRILIQRACNANGQTRFLWPPRSALITEADGFARPKTEGLLSPKT